MLQAAGDRPPTVSIHEAGGVNVLVEPGVAVMPMKPVHVSAFMDMVEDAGGDTAGHLSLDVSAAL